MHRRTRVPAAEPRAASDDAALVRHIEAALAREGRGGCGARPLATRPTEVRRVASCSNELTEVRCTDGRSLVVKRGRYAWDGPRFQASRLAADLLRRRTGVIAPRHLDVGAELGGRAVEAYWRIELPTLRERWPLLSERERARALRSWGALLRRVHKVRLLGHGSLARAVREPSPLATFLSEELEARLPPAVARWWPGARGPVGTLRAFVPHVAARVGGRPGVLLHNDPHFGNLLCEPHGRGFRCGGVLDLEAAMAGPPEADLAHVQVLHGPLLGEPLPGPWFERVLDGYGTPADPVALAFFRAYHLLNLGIHAAMVGLSAHAADVAGAASDEVTRLAGLVRGAGASRAA